MELDLPKKRENSQDGVGMTVEGRWTVKEFPFLIF